MVKCFLLPRCGETVRAAGLSFEIGFYSEEDGRFYSVEMTRESNWAGISPLGGFYPAVKFCTVD